MPMTRRLLIVTREFAPSQGVGAQRPLRLVRWIRRFGWEPYVLTAPAACQAPSDPRIGSDVMGTTRIVTVPCRSLWRHARHWPKRPQSLLGTLAVAGRALAKLTYPLCPIDMDSPWRWAAARTAASIVRRYHIDLIWATTPLTCLSLAAETARRTGVPYVVDFRDVKRAEHPSRLPPQDRRGLQIERDVLRRAAGITYVAPQQAQVLMRKHAFVADLPQCLVYNGFEPEETVGCPPTAFDRPTILHGGGLYEGARRVDGFLAALASLRRWEPGGAGRVRFVNLGLDDDLPYLTRSLSGHGVEGMVELRSSLPRREFLSACRGADALLLVVGHSAGAIEHAGTIPGKLYDYFAACRPILVVGPPDCEAATMVTRLNRGLAVPDDGPEAIAEAIRRLLAGRGRSGPLDLSLEAVREFESSRVIGQMAEFLSALCSAGGRGENRGGGGRLAAPGRGTEILAEPDGPGRRFRAGRHGMITGLYRRFAGGAADNSVGPTAGPAVGVPARRRRLR